jgi:hypothetical protein
MLCFVLAAKHQETTTKCEFEVSETMPPSPWSTMPMQAEFWTYQEKYNSAQQHANNQITFPFLPFFIYLCFFVVFLEETTTKCQGKVAVGWGSPSSTLGFVESGGDRSAQLLWLLMADS